MNETLKTIYQRRAIRKYQDRLVDRRLVDEIIDAGRMAPSALNRQPWQFYVLTKKTMIKSFSRQIALASLKEIAKTGVKDILGAVCSFFHSQHDLKSFKLNDFIFHEAPVVIFITAPKENEWAALDIGMCSQNMMLAAKSLGLESCPVGLGKFIEKTKAFSELRVPKEEEVHLAITFGYGNEVPDIKIRKKNNVHFIEA